MRSTIAVLLLALPSAGAQDAPDPAKTEFFESKVRPLLEARCFKCHGPDTPKPKGGLRLDTREAALKGGDTGPALVPRDPEKSLFVSAVRRTDPDLAMPPKEALPQGEVDILVRWVKEGAVWSSGDAKPARKEKPITDEDRRWWSYQPVKDVPAPSAGAGWARNGIDRFLAAKLEAEGLKNAPEADRVTLIRRATFDLHGLPPSPAEVDAFAKDASPDAWEKLLDRLLASPRYGERWARRWLDLVRYAESDGYKQDGYRPHAWPYRDYVIRSFNEDKPYDRFVQEQLAGDELAGSDPEVFVATAFFRHGIYEYNQRNAPGQWRDILNDVTDVTGDVFLGLGMGCARCHDHKFDPILQADYYRLQSFFAGVLWRYDKVLATTAQVAEAKEKARAWEEKTAAIRAEIDKIEKPFLANGGRAVLSKFLPELQAMYQKSPEERTPYERQIADLIGRQMREEQSNIDGRIKGAERERWSALKRQLAEFDSLKPPDLTPALTVTDVAAQAPATVIPGTDRAIEPGFLAVLGLPAPAIQPTGTSSGRRTALARWLTDPSNPLAARVMANRIWQSHFGRGLVTTTSDYGRLGEKPSHPELLDWLAARFVESGWSMKSLHRLIMGSAAYRQASVHPDAAAGRMKDPENRWLWRMNPRRLESEEVRDAMLAASGELDFEMGGPSVDWNQPRRTVYTKVLRNTKDPLLEAFDAPESFSSVPDRNATTTATQALLMINGRWPLERAQGLAKRLRALKTATDAELVDEAWRIATGRRPSAAERERALAFLAKTAPGSGGAADLPLVQAMPDRGGQAARIRSANLEDRLHLSPMRSFPEGDFTIEAVVVLDSLYEDAAVRVIASQWNGNPAHPGWSLGITSAKSKHQPRNLILQFVGNEGYEVVPSDLHLELHKTHYVAASVRIAEIGQAGITFYLQDLSDPEASLRTASVKHANTGGLASRAAFVLGGRDGQVNHGWEGLIDEVRLSRVALPKDQLLIHENDPAPGVVAGHWRFEADPGFFKDSAGVQPPLLRPAKPKADPATSEAGLVDFCHVLLNSNGFLYVD